MSIRSLLIAIFLSAATFSHGADTPAEPPGIYKEIDVRLATDTMKALRDSKGDALTKVIGNITNQPENFAPPVLYVLSSVLVEQNKKDEAVFWFHAGQLRGLIDANICADKTAPKVIQSLNQRFGPPIKNYCLTNMSVFTNAVARVLAWEEETPCHYDRRWINLHTMNGLGGETNSVLTAPPEQWEAIRKRTREEWEADFRKAMDLFNQHQH
jgi:hypothetical protein